MEDGIELADLIWQLRHEMSRAMWAGEHTDLRFEAGPVELELTVVVEKSSQPGAKAKLVVVDAEWGASPQSLFRGARSGLKMVVVARRRRSLLDP